MRLRALDRIAKEIERRRLKGKFTAAQIGELLGDKRDGWQTGEDVTSICARRDDLGFDRIIQFTETMRRIADLKKTWPTPAV